MCVGHSIEMIMVAKRLRSFRHTVTGAARVGAAVAELDRTVAAAS
jgi:predicted alpha/beta hydrolase family esterase